MRRNITDVSKEVSLDDLTNAALKRLVGRLLTAKDGDEQAVFESLGKQARGKAKSEKNDLADLHEEMHGKYTAPMVDDDDEDNGGPESGANNDYDDDNGVQTARVKGPPAQKPVRSRGGDEDIPAKRGGGKLRPGNSDDDEDMPPARRPSRVNRRQDEDIA